MTVLHLSVLALVAILIGRLGRNRELVLLGASVSVIYWLEPPQVYVSLKFWLPTATLFLAIAVWLFVSPPQVRTWKRNWPAVLVLGMVVLGLDLNQFFGFEKIFMTGTPRVWMLALAVLCSVPILILNQYQNARLLILNLYILGILILFIYLKSPFLISKSLELIELIRGRQAAAGQAYLSWLGFSYIAFRLLHTIRDSQINRLPALTLGEYVNYVLFFPSITAGPIDRAERFVNDLRSPIPLTDPDLLEAGKRFFIGLLKKFVIADSLALVAINDVLVKQVSSSGWLWLFLYAYSLRIYFDFSGYTDIAIGLARVMGIRLPENFASPYLKTNLTLFWNSWHMTLTQWFRSYYFNPLTRMMRQRNFPVPIILLFTQVTTMLLIGLWHGISWGFVLWGIWHGLGLFVQNRWGEFLKGRIRSTLPAAGQFALNATGLFLTFNFVSLGWLLFTLSTPWMAWGAFLKLFGLN